MDEDLRPADDDPPASPPARPRPPRRTLVALVVPIIAVSVIGTIGNALHPTLLKNSPLLLVAMEPRNRFLLLVADKVDYLPFVVTATIRRLISDPLFYALGFLYGDSAVRWMEKRLGEGGGLIRGIEKWFSKAAPVMVFLLPGAIVCVLAGATGMPIALFLILNVAGTITVVTAMYRFADVVSGPLDAINGFYGRNNSWLTVASVVFTALWFVQQRRSGRGEIQSIESIEHDLEAEGTEGTDKP